MRDVRSGKNEKYDDWCDTVSRWINKQLTDGGWTSQLLTIATSEDLKAEIANQAAVSSCKSSSGYSEVHWDFWDEASFTRHRGEE